MLHKFGEIRLSEFGIIARSAIMQKFVKFFRLGKYEFGVGRESWDNFDSYLFEQQILFKN